MPIMFSNVRTAPSVDFSAGGMPFVCQAPAPGFALIGIQVRAGDWIDQVAPIFAELLEDGTLGPATVGPQFGGHGGVIREVRCAPGHIATGLQTRSGSYVDAVRLQQTHWDGTLHLGDSSWTPWVGGTGGVERPERLAEPSGAIVIGIAGRSGAFIDNLTMVSAEPMRFNATQAAKAGARPNRAVST